MIYENFDVLIQILWFKKVQGLAADGKKVQGLTQLVCGTSKQHNFIMLFHMSSCLVFFL